MTTEPTAAAEQMAADEFLGFLVGPRKTPVHLRGRSHVSKHKIAFQTLPRRIPGLRLDGDVRRRSRFVTRGLGAVPAATA